MDNTIFHALISFVFAATIIPGSNNIMVMASGANFGVRRSIPHLLGVSVGVLPIILLAGVGLMAIFDAVPALEAALRIVSTIYLLWLAWKIANATPPEAGDAVGSPLSGSTRKFGQPVYPRSPFLRRIAYSFPWCW